jgi:hypothetical protein
MKSNELIVGNWVEKTELKFSGLKSYFCQINISDLIHANLLKPIPLTEEWLVKFSLVLDRKIGQRNIYRHGKYGDIKCEVCGNGELAIYVNDNLIGFKRYVHSFQNLFYALTDEELKASEVTT